MWELVVSLVQVMFTEKTVLEEILWVTVVLLPKGKGEYMGIRIVELLCNVRSVVVHCWLKRVAVLHDALRVFREGRWIGTAMLEANMEQQLVGLAHKPLFQVLLDVSKSYDSLDR